MGNPNFKEFKEWKRSALEKAFRVVHILSLLSSGLLRENHNFYWFTDQNSIAANSNRVIQLSKLFGWIISMYLTFNIGHIKCGTTNCDDETRIIEDLAAIPDIIAGAVCEQMNLTEKDHSNLSNTVFYLHRGDLKEKTSKITWWFSDTNSFLKRHLCIVDIAPHSKEQRISWFHFYNQK